MVSSNVLASFFCKLASSRSGCPKKDCPFSHSDDDGNVDGPNIQENVDEQEDEDDFIRDFAGARVYFDDIGSVFKVSLPTDFSMVRITNLSGGMTSEEVADMIRRLGFSGVGSDCVRILNSRESRTLEATVKVEDPTFATEFISKLERENLPIMAIPVATNTQRKNGRKVYVSWNKPTCTAWLYFCSDEDANRVAKKFNEGQYTCLGCLVNSSMAIKNVAEEHLFDSVPWTIVLSVVPGTANKNDIFEAITAPCDRPLHVEVGPRTYEASEQEVSINVRSALEQYGPLESFHLGSELGGIEVKATALFAKEADAISACELKDKEFDILNNNKLTVTRVLVAKYKISTAVYLATRKEIYRISKTWWEEGHMKLCAYSNNVKPFKILKFECRSGQDVANASKALDPILNGITIKIGDNPVWDDLLLDRDDVYRKVKRLEAHRKIYIARDRYKRHLQYYGDPGRLPETALLINDILKQERLNYNSKLGQDSEASASPVSDPTMASHSVPDPAALLEEFCSICWNEPETPIRVSCKHTYCLRCFERWCMGATVDGNEMLVKCLGDGARCPQIFTLIEIKKHLSSLVFELVLKTSFGSYIKLHAEEFQYCPTPTCDSLYRCTPATNYDPREYTCTGCLETTCTSCHKQHAGYNCHEHSQKKSAESQATLEENRVLKIKNCSKCRTGLEKVEGCNHITCPVCKVHICWDCMMAFENGEICYKHMREEHGTREFLEHHPRPGAQQIPRNFG